MKNQTIVTTLLALVALASITPHQAMSQTQTQEQSPPHDPLSQTQPLTEPSREDLNFTSKIIAPDGIQTPPSKKPDGSAPVQGNDDLQKSQKPAQSQ